MQIMMEEVVSAAINRLDGSFNFGEDVQFCVWLAPKIPQETKTLLADCFTLLLVHARHVDI